MCELIALSTRHAAHLNVSLEALASHSGPAGDQRPDRAARLVPPGAVEQHGGATPACSGRGGRAGHAGRDLDRQRALDDRAWQPFAEGEVVVVAAGIVIHGGAGVEEKMP